MIRALICAAVIQPAMAITMESYEKNRDDSLFKAYVQGVAFGIYWANVDSRSSGTPVYCPSSIALRVINT